VKALLRRFPRGRLAVAPETPRWRRGLFLRGLERLSLLLR
jgi:cytochrome P450